MNNLNDGDQFSVNPDFAGPGQGHNMGPTFGKTLGNMKFMGIVGMVYGVMTCLSLVGAVLGVPIIIASNRFLEAIKILEEYRHSNRPEDMASAFHELGRSFRLMKIVVMITIGMTVLYFIFMFVFGGLALLAGLAEA